MAQSVPRDHMMAETHYKHAPWIVVRSNDKRRAHLALIRHILKSIDYEGRNDAAIGAVDEAILSIGPENISNG